MERSGNPQGPVDLPHDPLALPSEGVELGELGVLRVRDTDAEQFLQGQLSNDVARLARESSLLAGFHNPQGRTIALLRLVQAGEHDILALLPRDLAAPVAQRLSRFILRSKVRITDESTAWRVRGIARNEPPSGIALKVSAEPTRWISILPATSPPPDDASPAALAPGAVNAWRLLDIAAGLPQIYRQTSELFVAQMLNLDLIDGVSFSKGCYTGQEVVARAHYRGRVKRRMQRWLTTASAALAPGDSARLADGRTLRVVDAAQRPDGRCELLAVAPLATGQDEESAGAPDKALLEAEQLPLPYELTAV